MASRSYCRGPCLPLRLLLVIPCERIVKAVWLTMSDHRSIPIPILHFPVLPHPQVPPTHHHSPLRACSPQRFPATDDPRRAPRFCKLLVPPSARSGGRRRLLGHSVHPGSVQGTGSEWVYPPEWTGRIPLVCGGRGGVVGQLGSSGLCQGAASGSRRHDGVCA